ncbi:winged helix DNA-binding domain-containing protein [Sphingomonas sp. IC-11]|uniref:winged helix-turn-helix domain-containing protein n=1 Tax=Sphingomonas sp. IC-11 TaxID=2898528 RepID=UPI001E5C2C42|nr:crosslink repair DNA glycosylase YcaQ family protein [Sphingomonas sp. IC-11]MCD2315995.1 winged helix DNA-binding domain-containing protein [Sphingomonas sp. IC-11]
MEPERISPDVARRIALAAQGFGVRRPPHVTSAHLRRTLDRLALHQIDSVNVLARAHYLPAFSRLGSYGLEQFDRAAWGPRSHRRMFEYWAHEASLLPLDLHPLLRWRMERADRGVLRSAGMRRFATERRGEAMALLDRIRCDGALAASDVESSRTGWWEWSGAKTALEWLFYAGHVTTASRRRGFERVYDVPERVLPSEILEQPTPDEATAQASLVERAARALGIATAIELRDYFRLAPADAAAAIARLIAEDVLRPVSVDGWPTAYIHRDVKRPRRIEAHALLAPFDPLIWERARTERLFGFRYRIEIYVPADKRRYGYYVLPFLLNERIVARVDLKADRERGRLVVRSCHLEPGAPGETSARLELELETMAGWLGLGVVER